MAHHSPNLMRTQLLHSQLRNNESDCIRNNIRIRVDEINSAHNVAMCSVQQRFHGPFRRSYSQEELIGRGERALHPLQELGLMPMLTIHVPKLAALPFPADPWSFRSLMDWVKDVWHWAGSPLSREGFGALPAQGDPFGWKQAMRSSTAA